MPYTIGDTSKTLFLKQESHKLFEEFEVASATTIKKGMPVKVDTAGKLVPAVKAAGAQEAIGIAMQNGSAGTLVTVMMRAFSITYCEAGTASMNAGPVSLYTTAYNSTSGYVEVDDASVDHTNQVGWALDAATSAGDIVRVAWMA